MALLISLEFDLDLEGLRLQSSPIAFSSLTGGPTTFIITLQAMRNL